jgi:hypothetical protein
MGLLRESVDEETVNYLAEDPTLLRLLPVAVGEVGAHAADIGTAGVGLYRLGRAGVQAGLRRFNPSLADQFAPALRQLNESFADPIDDLLAAGQKESEVVREMHKQGYTFEEQLPSRMHVGRTNEAAYNELLRRGTPDAPEVPGLSPRGTGTVDEFTDVGMYQRGAPESAMNQAQHAYGGGVGSFVMEHVGDLTHRMADPGTFTSTAGYEYVSEKVAKTLRALKNKYGFNKEFLENILSNAKFRDQPVEEFASNVYRTMDDYAASHGQVPVINEAQSRARAAAIAVGRRQWDEAIEHLEELNKHLGSPDEWKKYAQQGLVDEVKEAPVIQFKKKEPQSVADIFEGRDDVNPMELYDELLRRKQAYEESIDAISGEGKEIEKKILKRSNFPDEANRLSGLHSSKTDEFVEVSNEYEKILRYIQRMEDEWGPGLEDLLPPVPTGPRRID